MDEDAFKSIRLLSTSIQQMNELSLTHISKLETQGNMKNTEQTVSYSTLSRNQRSAQEIQSD